MLGNGESGGTAGGAGGKNVSLTQSDDVETKDGGKVKLLWVRDFSGLHGEHKSKGKQFELTESLTQNFKLATNQLQYTADCGKRVILGDS